MGRSWALHGFLGIYGMGYITLSGLLNHPRHHTAVLSESNNGRACRTVVNLPAQILMGKETEARHHVRRHTKQLPRTPKPNSPWASTCRLLSRSPSLVWFILSSWPFATPPAPVARKATGHQPSAIRPIQFSEICKPAPLLFILQYSMAWGQVSVDIFGSRQFRGRVPQPARRSNCNRHAAVLRLSCCSQAPSPKTFSEDLGPPPQCGSNCHDIFRNPVRSS